MERENSCVFVTISMPSAAKKSKNTFSSAISIAGGWDIYQLMSEGASLGR